MPNSGSESSFDLLSELDALSRRLDPGPEDRRQSTRLVAEHVHAYLDALPDAPARFDRPDGGSRIREIPVSEDGIGLEAALDLLREHVDAVGLNPTSGRFFGYIPGGGLFTSGLGDWMAATTNRYAGVFFASPGAVRMENALIRWMADLIGFPETAGGYLAAGGSLANQTAIVAAREAKGVEGAAIERSVVYLTDHAHHCILKALGIAGLRRSVVRTVPVDERYRMRAEALQELLSTDRENGLTPFMIVASAGTTNTGSVDPLDAIADLAREYDAWYHVDAAYGGFFRLCAETFPETADLLEAMSRADSVVMDPHKTLFVPYGTGALIVRDRRHLLDTHSMDADYMQDTRSADHEDSPADLSPELTKHFRGLRLWLPLQAHGVAAFRAALSEKLLLARYFHRRIGELNGFEAGPEPDLSVVTFRYVPAAGDPDDFNRRLAGRLQRDGRVFLSSTQIEGRFTLRLAAVCFRSHREHVDEAIDILRETAAELEAER
ncbi:MAG: aminotransferase class V-fold PLP-dependent enzyme [Rhodothermales bacterium]|nr:aminotransferase class V-fold PLP-dependent enzyme [Rhodothermales bacterium]